MISGETIVDFSAEIVAMVGKDRRILKSSSEPIPM